MEELVIIQKSELLELIRKVVSAEIGKMMEVKPSNPKIKGIHGLAEAIGCSVSKAQTLKNSGVIRYFQDGKLVLFDYNQVIEDLQGTCINKRGRKKSEIS